MVRPTLHIRQQVEKVFNSMELLSLPEIQKESHWLLKQTALFLESHHLKYSLYAGTLLGAIRHQGFIPWDDDIDICMPRPSYDKLLTLFDQLPAPLFGVAPGPQSLGLQFAKICNSQIRAQEPSYDGTANQYLWIDVFPIDGVPTNDKERTAWLRKIVRLRQQRTWLSINPSATHSFPKRIIKQAYKALFPATYANKLDVKLDELLRKYPYDTSEFVSCYAGGMKIPLKYKKSEFEAYQQVPFEGLTLNAPGCHHQLLTDFYGDYMQLPPENARITHHLKAWRVS